MSNDKVKNLDVGTLLSIPCNIYQGPMTSDRVISCKVDTNPPIQIEGIVSQELIRNQDRVIAVIAEIGKDFVSILFNGEIFKPRNPIKFPIDWIQKHAEIESVSR